MHTGIYYRPGSLKAINCRAGKKAMEEFCTKENIPFDLCGKIIVATEESELPRMEMLIERGTQNGVVCNRITPEQIRKGSWRRDGDAAAPGDEVAPLAGTQTASMPAALELPPAAPEIPMAVEPARSLTAADAQGFWVQLGAFRQREGAEQFQRRVSDELEWLAPLLEVSGDASIYRLQAGPYLTRLEAQDAGARVRDELKLVPVIVERR
jgi:rare lipoprotein A